MTAVTRARRWLAGPLSHGLVWCVTVATLLTVDAGRLLLGLPAVALLLGAAARGQDAGRRARLVRVGVLGALGATAVGLVASSVDGGSPLAPGARVALAVVALGLVGAGIRQVPSPRVLGDAPDERVASEPVGPRG